MDPTTLEPKMLIPESEIRARIHELAEKISMEYQGREITGICILKGSVIFFSDIIRFINVPLSCEFLGLSSYGNEMSSSGEVKVTLDLNEPLEGKHVIVFEDIVDSGLTLKFILNTLKARKPASLKVCALLTKPSQFQTAVELDYTGFEIDNKFVVGYGMDASGYFRGLPYIGYIEKAH
jgi:hypoxanthine phosphoribosyltransferase